jgi:hypothetical protein
MLSMLLSGEMRTEGIRLYLEHVILLGQLIMQLKLILHAPRKVEIFRTNTRVDRRAMKKRRSSLKIRVASGRSPAIAILVPGAEPTAASSIVRAASTIPRWYARGDDSFLRLWLLEDRARLFLGRELVLLTSILQLLPVCKQIEGAAYLQVYPAPSIVVGGVPKIAVGAEGFLNAETIASLLCSTSRVPVLLFSCDSITLAYRDDDFVIVDLMPI